MIVAAWFTIVALVILAGFVMLGATFVHWYRENKKASKLQNTSSNLKV
ncbi:hypothetical protein QJS83_14635 [Bdellovibrio sp. 22V]|nr:hypothetical protein [Bdellovibrio sp. 22V]WII71703.1 hypothetical protein QJS83_14635 [Bdellovibrio sp. 22V]